MMMYYADPFKHNYANWLVSTCGSMVKLIAEKADGAKVEIPWRMDEMNRAFQQAAREHLEKQKQPQ